jgi:hypothetical protein
MFRFRPVLAAAAIASACGGETSSEPPMTRCEFRSLDDGALLLCSEAEADHDDPEACSAETAAQFPPPGASASLGEGPCADDGKAKGCRFAEFHSTIWGYGSRGLERVEALCGTVSGGELVDP